MRVRRAFAFLDLCGFTAFTEDRGDEAAVAILANLRSTLRAAAERRGVRVTKWLGDGAMLSGIQVHALAVCVLEVRDTIAVEGPLPVRAGIACGASIMFEGDDYVGAVVNVASRLTARAKPNQVLATDEAVGELRGLATSRPYEALRVTGLVRSVQVHELLAAVPAVAAVRGSSPGSPRVTASTRSA